MVKAFGIVVWIALEAIVGLGEFVLLHELDEFASGDGSDVYCRLGCRYRRVGACLGKGTGEREMRGNGS